MTSDPPERLNLDRFSTIHSATLREFDHLIEQDTISIRSDTDEVVVAGRLSCLGGVYLDVAIALTVDARERVEILRYTYHAGISDPRGRPIFRYDNAHTYAREGHPDPHHKHRFDLVTGDEIEPPEWIGEANRPTLHSVLTELEKWCLEHQQLLTR